MVRASFVSDTPPKCFDQDQFNNVFLEKCTMLLLSCLVSFDWPFFTRWKNTNNSFQYRHRLSHMYTGWRNRRSKNKALSTRPTKRRPWGRIRHVPRALSFPFSQPPCDIKRPLRRRERKESSSRELRNAASHKLACSRLRDSCEKSFSKRKCEKRAGALIRPHSALYYLRASHRLLISEFSTFLKISKSRENFFYG